MRTEDDLDNFLDEITAALERWRARRRDLELSITAVSDHDALVEWRRSMARIDRMIGFSEQAAAALAERSDLHGACRSLYDALSASAMGVNLLNAPDVTRNVDRTASQLLDHALALYARHG
jgi:hypothetical protein